MTLSIGRTSRLAALLTAVAIALAPGPAFAEPTAAEKETARAMMKDGRIKRDSGDHKGALEAFQAADTIMKVPTTGLEVGRSQVDLGLLVEARDTFLRVSRIPEQPGEPAPFKDARKEASDLAAKLEDRIPTLKMVVSGVDSGTSVAVTIDGNPVGPAMIALPQKLNPGTHRIVAIARGVKRSVDVELKEGELKEVAIDLTASGDDTPEPTPTGPSGPSAPGKPEAPAESGTSPLVYAGFAVAGVGVVVGSVTGILAMSKTNAAKDQCDGTRCPPATHDDLSSARTMATVSTISFVTALVGAGVGVYGLLGRGASAEPPKTSLGPLRQVEPVIGLGSIGLVGSF
ncbi:MAG: hypothetical protein HYV09_33045 [Deltaproteobacteria bacterium]|nr:hypothetical protein [Deltaproteobacteria bacterium]